MKRALPQSLAPSSCSGNPGPSSSLWKRLGPRVDDW
jgi:hypothetical protein